MSDSTLSTIVFHNSEVVSRMLPAPRHHELKYPLHGTRVTVRDLFGNIAVRVKQRAKVQASRGEQERAWHNLKRRVVEILVAWNAEIFFAMKDVDTQKEMKLRPRASLQACKQLSFQHVQDILVQSSYLSDYNDTWIPLSASGHSVKIKGAISVVPKPAKTVQFISFGILPIRNSGSGSILYDDINRIFYCSSFGFAEEELASRSQRDRNVISADSANMTTRKNRRDLDMWPMFYFNINIKEIISAKQMQSEDFLSDEQLKLTSKVLNKAIIEWLSSRGYTIQTGRKQRFIPAGQASIRSPSCSQTRTRSHRQTDHQGIDHARSSLQRSSRSCMSLGESQQGSCNQHRRTGSSSDSTLVKPRISERADPASADSISNTLMNSKYVHARIDSQENERNPSLNGDAKCNVCLSKGIDVTSPVEKGPVRCASSSNRFANNQEDQIEVGYVDESNNEALRWIDPLNGSITLVDSRTGNILPNQGGRAGLRPDSQRLSLRPSTNTSTLSLTSRKDVTWIREFLKGWKNTVFEPSDSRIPRANLTNNACRGTNQHIPESLELKTQRLNKTALSSCTVIGQVDTKFILTTMSSTCFASEDDMENQRTSKILVLVDQHAADERCKVEKLFLDLCERGSKSDYILPSCQNQSFRIKRTQLLQPVRFEASEQEAALFVAQRDTFLKWGIIFDTDLQRKHDSNDEPVIIVHEVPMVIAERCRSEPKLLIELLRSEIWRNADSGIKNGLTQALAVNCHDGNRSWSKHLELCPTGLIELINSRACRSAIMFNDTLSHEECVVLIEKLAESSLPFQCAHGRPSMVPLIDLGRKEHSVTHAVDNLTNAFGHSNINNKSYQRGSSEISFAAAYKRWRSSM